MVSEPISFKHDISRHNDALDGSIRCVGWGQIYGDVSGVLIKMRNVGLRCGLAGIWSKIGDCV